MIANLGNFARSQKILHPRISSTQVSKATRADDPSSSLFVRMFEGMASHIYLLCETYEISDKELKYLRGHAKLHSKTSFNKGLTVLARGENVTVTILSDNTNSLYHQLFYKAKADNVEEDKDLPKVPTLAGDFALFEIDFGTIGTRHEVREQPKINVDPKEKEWFHQVKRSRLLAKESPDSERNKLSRANMHKIRVCVFHIHHEIACKSASRATEFLCYVWEE
jgi:hypothetical protein